MRGLIRREESIWNVPEAVKDGRGISSPGSGAIVGHARGSSTRFEEVRAGRGFVLVFSLIQHTRFRHQKDQSCWTRSIEKVKLDGLWAFKNTRFSDGTGKTGRAA
jgi:hypothetical protein